MEKYQISPNKPWFRFWLESVWKELDYPEIPLFGLLSRVVEKLPASIAFWLWRAKAELWRVLRDRERTDQP
ncbi:hypothetical protein ES703_118909 [subsurface metagenome]